MVTSSVTHDMITPLRSVSCLSKRLSETLENTNGHKDALLIYNTSQILLSQVKLLLDKNLLDNNRFMPSLDDHPINQTIENIVDILKL